MSTITRLGITGFRSYSCKSVEVIEFFSPLTAILGKNGSGKTTITEVLKYAICGALPPNSERGKTFIRDPKLDANTESKANVKLLVKSITGKPILCVRTATFGRTSK